MVPTKSIKRLNDGVAKARFDLTGYVGAVITDVDSNTVGHRYEVKIQVFIVHSAIY